MIIDETNYRDGNLAMAAALVLYYQLATEGRFSYNETVYIDRECFDGFRFLDVKVHSNYGVDIDQALLREAAVFYLLCDLNDAISEHEDSFRSMRWVRRLVSAHQNGKLGAIPEASELLKLLEDPEQDFDNLRYHQTLAEIFESNTLGTFRRLSAPE